MADNTRGGLPNRTSVRSDGWRHAPVTRWAFRWLIESGNRGPRSHLARVKSTRRPPRVLRVPGPGGGGRGEGLTRSYRLHPFDTAHAESYDGKKSRNNGDVRGPRCLGGEHSPRRTEGPQGDTPTYQAFEGVEQPRTISFTRIFQFAIVLLIFFEFFFLPSCLRSKPCLSSLYDKKFVVAVPNG